MEAVASGLGYVQEVVISCGAEIIARHPRSYEREDFVFIGAVPEFLAPTTARRHLCGAVMAMSPRWLSRPVSRSALRGEHRSGTKGRRWMISLNGRA
jgi:hypothetical protein